MYQANAERKKQEAGYANYADYLLSLEMDAQICPFAPVYMARIAQLTNKSNQFNLTTKRCSQSDIERIAEDASYITLYGRLEDRFGDNGVVSVVFGHRDAEDETLFHIDLWLMSCRVLKRDMELAMMDELIERAKAASVQKVYGYYYPTLKNKMVRDFYDGLGFDLVNEDELGNKTYILDISNYKYKNKVIEVNNNE